VAVQGGSCGWHCAVQLVRAHTFIKGLNRAAHGMSSTPAPRPGMVKPTRARTRRPAVRQGSIQPGRGKTQLPSVPVPRRTPRQERAGRIGLVRKRGGRGHGAATGAHFRLGRERAPRPSSVYFTRPAPPLQLPPHLTWSPLPSRLSLSRLAIHPTPPAGAGRRSE
jgi:hypothetical protein